MNNVTVIIWTCITVAVLLGICALVLLFISSRNMKKNREAMRDLQGAIKVGAKILFAGGIYGKIVTHSSEQAGNKIGMSLLPRFLNDALCIFQQAAGRA